jgi:hypothetical protein
MHMANGISTQEKFSSKIQKKKKKKIRIKLYI